MCTSLHLGTLVLQECKFEHIWTCLEQVWTHLNKFEHIWTGIEQALNKFEHDWTHLNRFEHIWTHLNKFWTSLKMFKHIWTHSLTFEQVWTSLKIVWIFICNNNNTNAIRTQTPSPWYICLGIRWYNERSPNGSPLTNVRPPFYSFPWSQEEEGGGGGGGWGEEGGEEGGRYDEEEEDAKTHVSQDVWTHLNTFANIWTGLNKFEDVWTHLNTFANIWTGFEQVWTQLNTFKLNWTTFFPSSLYIWIIYENKYLCQKFFEYYFNGKKQE